ncbi:AMP-binding protein [Conexibacter stalactiti]|uniref:AMP-binding protein n=1 Tax=Conexibacter stalactiti TaxID=1940611 RepID=A0ABU4HIL0_9ACTN|nr:AMP-binding protein [Conexibacter stalactiti]MDW5593155.1 AMP-binding protein [Conexibacter stalactiti]MEC5033796.1 AMP-binding protein [Conexibacter stalactiti]
MDFAHLIRQAARHHRENVAVVHGDREQTYTELFERASRLANALRGLGLAQGDRVALLTPNGFETIEQLAGVALGGYVRSGLYTHQTGELNAYMMDLVDARALLVHADHVEEIEPHLGALTQLEHVLVFGGDARGHLAYERVLADAAPDDPQVELRPGDGHVVRFSAGTTGRPKGIYHTNAAWMNVENEWRLGLPQLDDRDRYLAAGPLTHLAIICVWPILQAGGRVVVMEAFDPGRALELIERERISFAVVVPTMIQALLDDPDVDRRDLSSLRCLHYAASPISERTAIRALERFGPILVQMYAQSEAIPATMLHAHQHLPQGSERERRWLRSIGRPTPNTIITVVDDAGRALPAGEVGEIAISSPGRMTEIWKDPAATAERLLPDGSVLTRDMGYMDEEGFVYLSDRKEDLIISGGYNIWPAELERAIATHAAVREVCVVGVPHERWGETPKAVVVLEEGASLSAAEVIELTREQVGSVKKVTSVEFAGELPKSGVGKVLRREVRAPFWPDVARHVSGA